MLPGEQAVSKWPLHQEALVTPPVMAQEWRVWGEMCHSPSERPYACRSSRPPVAGTATHAVYPLGKTRTKNAEVATVRRWRAEGVSGNVICERIFGPMECSSGDIIRRSRRRCGMKDVISTAIAGAIGYAPLALAGTASHLAVSWMEQRFGAPSQRRRRSGFGCIILGAGVVFNQRSTARST